MVKLDLDTLPSRRIKGIYGQSKTLFPRRMARLHPSAARAFEQLDPEIVYSDMWRSAQGSFDGRYPGGRRWPRRGVARPAHSAHNYGLAVDVAVTLTLGALGMTKRELDEYMAGHGWWCHRIDHKRKSEEWHYNYLGADWGGLPAGEKRTSHAIERKIKRLYGAAWDCSPQELQRRLRAQGLYFGVIDGKLGRFSKKAIKRFQSQWRLKVDGLAGPKTNRLLWYVTAERAALAS